MARGDESYGGKRCCCLSALPSFRRLNASGLVLSCSPAQSWCIPCQGSRQQPPRRGLRGALFPLHCCSHVRPRAGLPRAFCLLASLWFGARRREKRGWGMPSGRIVHALASPNKLTTKHSILVKRLLPFFPRFCASPPSSGDGGMSKSCSSFFSGGPRRSFCGRHPLLDGACAGLGAAGGVHFHPQQASSGRNSHWLADHFACAGCGRRAAAAAAGVLVVVAAAAAAAVVASSFATSRSTNSSKGSG